MYVGPQLIACHNNNNSKSCNQDTLQFRSDGSYSAIAPYFFLSHFFSFSNLGLIILCFSLSFCTSDSLPQVQSSFFHLLLVFFPSISQNTPIHRISDLDKRKGYFGRMNLLFSIGMRERSNGLRAMTSLDKVSVAAHTHVNHNHQKTNNDDANNNNHHHGAGGGGGGSASSETADDKKKGGSSSGSEAIPMVWPTKFVIGLTNKEKEDDFMAMKGSKLPQRPKKRSKIVQRTLNLISPGAWLCDLSLERYEVREKKASKKRPRESKL